MQVDSIPTDHTVPSPIVKSQVPDDRLGGFELEPVAAAYKGNYKP